MNDKKLVKLCINKNQKAWGIFLNKYSHLIYWAIKKSFSANNYSYSQTDTEDIFQEVFLLLFKHNKLTELKKAQHLPGWLSMLTYNKTTDYLRRKISRKEELIADFPTFGDTSFQEELKNKETYSLIKSSIEDLPDKDRIIITLNLLQEKSHKEISQIVNLPINTVSTIIHRTKEKIRKKIKKMKEI